MSEDRPADPQQPESAAADDAGSGSEAVRLRRKGEQTPPEASAADTTSAEATSGEATAEADADASTPESTEPAAPRRRVFDPTAGGDADDEGRGDKGKRGGGKKKRGARGGGNRGRRGGGGGGGGRGRSESSGGIVDENATSDDFAAMFEASGGSRRDSGTRDPSDQLEPGQTVTGSIIQIGAENAFVDLGGKTEAFISREELVDDQGEITVGEGDEITARVVRIERGGQIRLSRGASRGSGSAQVEEAFHAGLPVHGTVSSVNKGGFEVDIFGQRGFCPISHIDTAYTEDPQVHVGQSYEFKIIEYAESGRRLVVSRSELLREQQRERAEQLRDKLGVDAVLEGTVSSLQDYGAFVDLGGIDGLVHVSEISHSRVDHPSDVLQAGQKVKVKILSIEQTRKGERIALSIKGAQADPWEDANDWLSPGSRMTGTVVRLAPFGAFVELAPGIEGLVHISELSWEKHVRHPREVLAEGDSVEVQILNVEPESRRVALSLKAALGDPWEGIAERYEVGQEVTGTVEKLAEFGVFVKVEAGIVALIPMSELGTRPGVPAARDFSVGQEVTARVLAADEERRRLTLSRKDEAEVVSMARGVQRRREGDGGGDERGGRGGGGRGRRPRGRSDRGDRGGASSYREAAGNFATLGDLLKGAQQKKNDD